MAEHKRLSAREAADILSALKKPTILMHKRPDGDTVGSAVALYRALLQMGIQADIISDDPIPERLQFLSKGVPIAETLADRELVAVDVASPSQLGALFEKADKPLIMIDHHRTGTPFADGYIIPDCSSAAEVLFKILEELISAGKIKLTEALAYPLYAAISSDTGGFIYSSVSPETLGIAARLIETGIDFADINHRLFNSKSREQICAEGFVASKLETAVDGKIAYVWVSRAERESLGLLPEHFETAIDIVRALLGAEVAVFAKENDDGTVRVSLRSVEGDVSAVAAYFGGGGHIHAAGCSPDAKSAEEAALMAVAKVKELIFKA